MSEKAGLESNTEPGEDFIFPTNIPNQLESPIATALSQPAEINNDPPEPALLLGPESAIQSQPQPNAPIRVYRLKAPFGRDPLGQGFYWPSSKQKRSEVLSVKRNSPSDFESIYQGRPGARQGTIFLDADLNAFFQAEINGHPFPHTEFLLGRASPYVRAFTARGHSVVQAWDTAFSTTLTSAWTVCVTALFVPCQSYHCNEDPAVLGPCEFHFDVLILDVFRKRLDFADLLPAIKTQFQLWHPQEVVIEKKASGIDAIAALKNAGDIPIVPVTPQDGKRQRAVNSVGLKTAGSVQGWFRQHRVLTPVFASWLATWRREMKDFSGNDDSSSDQVDSTVHLVTRGIIAGSSMLVLPVDWAPERASIPGHLMPQNQGLGGGTVNPDPRAVLLASFGELEGSSEDPYYGTCARCFNQGDKKPCPVTGRRMLAMDACDQYSDSPPTDFNMDSLSFRNPLDS